MKELVLRGDLRRCLVVAPGGLVAQWQDELAEKFGLRLEILTRDMIEAPRTCNPFEERELLIARLDHLARNDDLQAKLQTTDWDLVVVDEAHRMAAHWFGSEVKETKRYVLGKRLASLRRPSGTRCHRSRPRLAYASPPPLCPGRRLDDRMHGKRPLISVLKCDIHGSPTPEKGVRRERIDEVEGAYLAT